MINPAIFREYDIRGVVGDDLTPEVAAAIARAYARWLRQRGTPSRKVVVGQDNRASSPALAQAAIRALRAGGFDVEDIGTVITPVFYFARVHLGIDGGVMVTASHNPAQFNGFKLAQGFGTLYGEEIQDIRRLAGTPGEGISAPGALGRQDIVPAYLAMLREKIRLGPRRLRVAVDCGNGTASLMAPQALRQLGCEVIPLYCESDPRFPHHHPDPTQEENLRDLIALVRQERADVGIGLDGDGDRIGVVDEQGGIIWGDVLMILFWREILPRHPGTVGIVEVKCSQALYDEIARLGGKPIFYRTGHSLIKAKMKEVEAVFTGEMSGHMFFADEYYGYDDAVYAAARLLRILSHADRPLSALLADVPQYASTPEVRVECPDEVKFEVVRKVTEEFGRRYQVIDIDGARVLFEDGWGLIRASNTQPALVLRAEARTADGLERIKRTLSDLLQRFPTVGAIRW
ncbi:MAG: phosphomannomutase [Armatimonadetes bacterium RBG_19FT_COMBO_69_19]|nr:MAG: phosphomannomutase [Armatimonadetes bacterium RBG_19FT_COMBO_69_19]